MLGDKLLDTLGGVIGRVIVDHNTLPLISRSILLDERLEGLQEHRGAVVGRYDY